MSLVSESLVSDRKRTVEFKKKTLGLSLCLVRIPCLDPRPGLAFVDSFRFSKKYSHHDFSAT